MCSKGRVKPVPLAMMPITTVPFSRVAIDLVVPLEPYLSEGPRFILTRNNFSKGSPFAWFCLD